MKIALIYFGRRGAGGPLSLALGKALAQHAELAAFISNQQETLPAWSGAAFPVHSLPTFSTLPGVIWSFLQRGRLNAAVEQIRAFKPDVLLFTMIHPWNAALQKALAPIPSVVMVHDPRPHPGLIGSIIRKFEDPSLQRAARCMVFSHSLIADLYNRGVQAGRISVAPLGLMDYTEGRELPSPRPPVVLFFGRITQYKGLEVLLTAFEQVQRQMPQARLIVAGSGSLHPYQAQLRRLSQVQVINRWLDDHEIGEIFSRAGVVALPYTSASQSGVLTIAASFALPVVATRTGGLTEQILDGKTGLLIEPDDAQALVHALLRLLQDAPLAQTLGANLRQDYLSAKNWERAAQTVFQTCRAALGEASDL